MLVVSIPKGMTSKWIECPPPKPTPQVKKCSMVPHPLVFLGFLCPPRKTPNEGGNLYFESVVVVFVSLSLCRMAFKIFNRRKEHDVLLEPHNIDCLF